MRPRCVVDTHTAIWNVYDDVRLGAGARETIYNIERQGGDIVISSITLSEIVYLLDKPHRTDPVPADVLDRLLADLADPEAGLTEVPFDSSIARYMLRVPRQSVRDPGDRMIVATALKLGCPLLTSDNAILDYAHNTPGGLVAIWSSTDKPMPDL